MIVTGQKLHSQVVTLFVFLKDATLVGKQCYYRKSLFIRQRNIRLNFFRVKKFSSILSELIYFNGSKIYSSKIFSFLFSGRNFFTDEKMANYGIL